MSEGVQNLDDIIRGSSEADDPGLASYLLRAKPDEDGRFDSPHKYSKPYIGEDKYHWTTRLTRSGAYLGVYRQCSIGWHSECSQRDEGPKAECRCTCHTGHRYGEEQYG